MKRDDIKLAIIGGGRWGMNHVNTAVKILPPQNITVCDINRAIRTKLKSINDGIKFTTRLNDIIFDSGINSAIIATPAETHYLIAYELLKNKKNILVEKPITLHPSETKILIKIADNNYCKLMVGHVLLYHPAIIKMKKLIKIGMLGRLQYIYSNRLNLGAVRKEENILWSFAPHDISIIQYLTEGYPEVITAHGGSFLQDKIEDTTLTYFDYPNNVKAHIFVSWLNPFKEQRLVVVGEKGMLVFEDTLKEGKLKFFTKGFENHNGSFEKFDDGVSVIEHENSMPLTEEHLHFYDCILEDKKPKTDGQHALEVLEILQEATKQLKNRENKIIPEKKIPVRIETQMGGFDFQSTA